MIYISPETAFRRKSFASIKFYLQ